LAIWRAISRSSAATSAISTPSNAPQKASDGVCHLAFINGTDYFYTIPERILEVAVKG